MRNAILNLRNVSYEAFGPIHMNCDGQIRKALIEIANNANEDSNMCKCEKCKKSACVQFEKSVCVQMDENISVSVQVNENSKYISTNGCNVWGRK